MAMLQSIIEDNESGNTIVKVDGKGTAKSKGRSILQLYK